MEQVLLEHDGKAVIIKSQEYGKEIELQELIKKNPHLIKLSSIFKFPMMIIGRESENIDVLAITAEAVPVIIECKRKNNPDMRYLIAQVFEYASKLSQKTYNEFDEMVTKYFASDRCEEKQYRNLSLKEAFLNFRASIPDPEEAYEESGFINDLAENLKNGEFYLLMVMDKISDVTSKTIQFLNSKMKKMRIEIIEVSKFSDENRAIYVPDHINPERDQKGEAPGKITFEEMREVCGQKEGEYIREFRKLWEEGIDFSIEMGTKGFSARHKDIPILYVLPEYIQIAPRIKRKYEKLFPALSQILKKHFSKSTETTVKFSTPGFSLEKLRGFVEEVKEFWDLGHGVENVKKESNSNT